MKKMNKLFVALFVAGSFAMLLGSCKKNDTASTMNIGLPQFEEEMEGRAYIDITNSNSFKWNANDQVMAYNIDALHGDQTVKAIWSTNASAEGKATILATRWQTVKIPWMKTTVRPLRCPINKNIPLLKANLRLTMSVWLWLARPKMLVLSR